MRQIRIVRYVVTLAALVGAASVLPSVAPSLAAQTAGSTAETGRLTVRPEKMATGTKTDLAGVQRLDSIFPNDTMLEGAVVYVPKRCVGTTRCAFGVLLHGGVSTGMNAIEGDDRLFQIFADSLGMIVLAPSSHSEDQGWQNPALDSDFVDIPRIDAAMKTVLAHYAIDPTHVILMGGSAGAGAALDWGYVNGDIFSRVICFEAWMPFNGIHEFDKVQAHGKPAFYFGLAKDESAYLDYPNFVPWLQKQGYSATLNEDDGDHAMTMERGKKAFDWLVKTPGWR